MNDLLELEVTVVVEYFQLMSWLDDVVSLVGYAAVTDD